MELLNTKDLSMQKKSYLIFGGTKTGKTLLAATLPESEVLLINTENNLDSLYGANINIVNCQSYDDLIGILDNIAEFPETYKWLYIDSFSDIMTKIFNEEFAAKDGKQPDGRQAYAKFDMKYGEIIGRIKNLPCNIVAIGRMTQIKDETTGGFISGAAMPWAKLQSDLPYNFSAVFATLAWSEMEGDKEKINYSIQCRPCNKYQVGARTQFGKTNPLEQYEAPDIEAIHKKLTS